MCFQNVQLVFHYFWQFPGTKSGGKLAVLLFSNFLRCFSRILTNFRIFSEIQVRNISEITQIYPVPQQAGQKVSKLVSDHVRVRLWFCWPTRVHWFFLWSFTVGRTNINSSWWKHWPTFKKSWNFQNSCNKSEHVPEP